MAGMLYCVPLADPDQASALLAAQCAPVMVIGCSTKDSAKHCHVRRLIAPLDDTRRIEHRTKCNQQHRPALHRTGRICSPVCYFRETESLSSKQCMVLSAGFHVKTPAQLCVTQACACSENSHILLAQDFIHEEGTPELGLATDATSMTAGEAGPTSALARSLREARFTISARTRRPSGSSSICRRSPERTECDSANAFQPCRVYSYLLLFLHNETPRSGHRINQPCPLGQQDSLTHQALLGVFLQDSRHPTDAWHLEVIPDRHRSSMDEDRHAQPSWQATNACLSQDIPACEAVLQVYLSQT